MQHLTFEHKKTWQVMWRWPFIQSCALEAVTSYFRKFSAPQIGKLAHADFEYYSQVIHSSPPSCIVLYHHSASFHFRILHHSSSNVVLFSVMTRALLPEGLLLVEPRNLGRHEVLTLPGWRPSVVRATVFPSLRSDSCRVCLVLYDFTSYPHSVRIHTVCFLEENDSRGQSSGQVGCPSVPVCSL